MISSVSAVLGLCVFLRAGTTYSTAQAAPVACSPVTSVDDIQPVFDKAASQKSVCVKFKGKGGAACVSVKQAPADCDTCRSSTAVHFDQGFARCRYKADALQSRLNKAHTANDLRHGTSPTLTVKTVSSLRGYGVHVTGVKMSHAL